MNIYELEKKATPAPWRQVYGNYIHAGDAASVATPGLLPQIGYMLPFNGTTEELEQTFSNVRLAAHCRNNFLKALDALKRCRNHISGDPTFGACPMGLDELITELEKP